MQNNFPNIITFHFVNERPGSADWALFSAATLEVTQMSSIDEKYTQRMMSKNDTNNIIE